MLSFLIILVFLYFFYEGSQRGVWLQLVHIGGYLISLLVATLGYKALAAHLTLLVPYPSATEQSQFVFFSNQVGLTLDHAFYRGVAFVLILALGWLLTRFAALWVHDLKYRPVDPTINGLAGGVLNLLMGYVFVFLLLYLVALIPVAGLQHMLADSFVAKLIVRYSLGLTGLFTHLWLVA
ncbi:CvpA family protein [Lacticaseibacillus absianus]|uniref:CvpA family protein n=1 Tax=Lacticaseibacillus absianus TaxID=2729623 RepID=UPI0015C78A06|nr:CvpA family protein [Lacticaseibacillus absianus]